MVRRCSSLDLKHHLWSCGSYLGDPVLVAPHQPQVFLD
jgi:hypothetical protein